MYGYLKNKVVVGCGHSIDAEFECVPVDPEVYVALFDISEHKRYRLEKGKLVRREFERPIGNTRLISYADTADVLLDLQTNNVILSDKAESLLVDLDTMHLFYIERTTGYLNASNKAFDSNYQTIDTPVPNNVNIFIINPFKELTYGIKNETL